MVDSVLFRFDFLCILFNLNSVLIHNFPMKGGKCFDLNATKPYKTMQTEIIFNLNSAIYLVGYLRYCCNSFYVCVGIVEGRAPVHECLARLIVTRHDNVGKSDRV